MKAILSHTVSWGRCLGYLGRRKKEKEGKTERLRKETKEGKRKERIMGEGRSEVQPNLCDHSI